MFTIRTERLFIVVLPVDYPVAELKRKSAVKALFKLQAKPQNTTGAEQTQSNVCCAIFNTNQDNLIGFVTSLWKSETGICYAGFSIEPKHRGLGYATEAFRAVCEWLLSDPDVKAIVSETFSDFAASIKVMEKAGMAPIEANLGSEVVRRALVKSGTEIDLTEKEVLTLIPYRQPRAYRLGYFLKWQLRNYPDLILVGMFTLLIVHFSGPYHSLVGGVGLSGCTVYFVARFLRWWRWPTSEMLVQFRSSGFFYANRGGFGDLISWKVYSSFKLSKRGGLDLWNGQEWYWIPPAAFTETSFAKAKEFLLERGVKLKDT